MTILVTGATGLIGREFIRIAGARFELVALTRDRARMRSSAAEPSVEWIEVDLSNRSFTQRLPQRVDAIVHLAQSRAYRDFPSGATDVFEVNLEATARLLDYARAAGTRRFVHASTATLYEPSQRPLTERSPIHCTSFYAASKRAAELLIGQYEDLMECWVMRIFTVYGAGQRDQLIADLIHRVRTGHPVTVQGRSGLPISPIHAADVARALGAAASATEPLGAQNGGVVNVGGCERVAIRELAEEIGRAVGKNPQFIFAPGDDPPGWVADRSKLERVLPLPEPVRLADGIRATVVDTANASSMSRRRSG